MIHALNMVWNPSEGIDLGFFMLRYYSLMFVVAFGLGWYIMKHIYQREEETIEKLDNLFVLHSCRNTSWCSIRSCIFL